MAGATSLKSGKTSPATTEAVVTAAAAGAAQALPEATPSPSSEVKAKAAPKVEPVIPDGSFGEIAYPPCEELTKLLYGEPGVGKTTFAASMPGAFIVATEPGHDFIKAPVRRIYRWAPDPDKKDTRLDFQTVVRGIYDAKRDGKFKYRVVVIDIVDNLYSMCLDHVCQRKGIDYPPESDFGKTWKEVRVEWEQWLRALLDVVSVTFITHCATDKITLETKGGIKKEIERRVPTFRGNKPAQFLDGVLNVMGFVHRGADGEPQVIFRADPTLGTKDRTGVFEKMGAIPLKWADVNGAYEGALKAQGIKIKSKWEA